MSEELQKKETTAIKVKDIGQQEVTNMVLQVQSFAQLEGTPLTPCQKGNAVNMTMAIMKKVSEKEITDFKTKQSRYASIKDFDVVGCQLPQQIKRFARLGLSFAENELFVETRFNKHSPLQSINIKKQYQGIEKEIINYCSKKVIRFLTDVICTGDDFETETDFETGLQKVIKHKKNQTKDFDRNKMENIIGAYKIAYAKEDGKNVQYIAVIDKNRIMRAYNAATTKNVWNADTQRMVLKTVSWVLYNNILKPYMQVPEDLKDDWQATSENDFDFEQEKVQASEVAEENTATGEVVDVDFEDVEGE